MYQMAMKTNLSFENLSLPLSLLICQIFIGFARCYGGYDMKTGECRYRARTLWVWASSGIRFSVPLAYYNLKEMCTMWFLLLKDCNYLIVRPAIENKFGLLPWLLYSFPPPLFKTNAVYQSYYIQRNGHTIALTILLSKMFNKSWTIDFLIVVGFLLYLDVRTGRKLLLGNKTKLGSNIYTMVIYIFYNNFWFYFFFC